MLASLYGSENLEQLPTIHTAEGFLLQGSLLLKGSAEVHFHGLLELLTEGEEGPAPAGLRVRKGCGLVFLWAPAMSPSLLTSLFPSRFWKDRLPKEALASGLGPRPGNSLLIGGLRRESGTHGCWTGAGLDGDRKDVTPLGSFPWLCHFPPQAVLGSPQGPECPGGLDPLMAEVLPEGKGLMLLEGREPPTKAH